MATWTNEELELLKANYNKLATCEIGEQLNRSPNAVRHKAQRLGLAQKRKFWDEDDEVYLEYFAYERDSKLNVASEFLGRSVNATQLRLSKIRGNRRDYYICKPWTKKEDDFIRSNYKAISYASIAVRLNRSHKAVMGRARELGLRKYISIVVLDDQIRQLAKVGMCPTDISRELNIKITSLQKYLKKHQIEYTALTTEQSLERANAKSPWHKFRLDLRKR